MKFMKNMLKQKSPRFTGHDRFEDYIEIQSFNSFFFKFKKLPFQPFNKIKQKKLIRGFSSPLIFN